MSRIVPVSYKKFDAFLRHIGCKLARQKGDHRIYTRDGLIRPIVVPAVKELPIFIIRNNLRVLGISPDQYTEIIGRV